MLLKDSDQREILIYAFRYALGRCTYAPHTIVDILKSRWWDLSEGDRALFIKEIREASDLNLLGHDCDRAGWMQIARLPIKRENEHEISKQLSEGIERTR